MVWRRGTRLRRGGASPALVTMLAAFTGQGAAAAGTVDTGRAIFEAQCAVCHATQPEFHKEGPSLAGFYGRRAGTAPFFAGYRGLKGADFVWDERNLDAWLADPRSFLGGRNTTMTLRLADPAQRQAVIAYLKTMR